MSTPTHHPTAPASVLNAAGRITFGAPQIRRAEQLIDRSGVVEEFTPALPAGGRPRQLPLRALLVGLALLATSREPLYLNQVAPLLNNLPAPARRRLGLTRPAGVTTRQVEVLFAHLAAAVDGSPHYGGARLNTDERASRDEALARLTDRLLDASLPTDYHTKGHLAFDATLIDANSRPEATARRRAARAARTAARAVGASTDLQDLLRDDDELANALGVPAWNSLDATDAAATLARTRRTLRRAADPDAATIVYKKRLRHAYALHLAVDVGSETDVAAQLAHDTDTAEAAADNRPVRVPAPEPTPLLVRRMKLTAATENPAPVATDVLTRLAAEPHPAGGWRPGDLLADRGYTNATPDAFHHPLRAAGFRLVFDLHQERRGVTGSHEGAVILNGDLYSPGILNYPDLCDNRQPGVGATRAQWERHFALVERRRPFLLAANGRPDADGYVRRGCPAMRGKLGCPLRNTLNLTMTKGVPEVFEPPTAPLPTVCSQRYLTVPPDVLAHANDGVLHGSRAWYDSFHRRRPRVEGANGILKNPALGGVAPMRLRVRGRAKTTLMLAFLVAAANLRATDAWRAELARIRALNAAIEAAPRTRRRRRTNTLRQLTAAGTAPPRAP